MKYRIKLTPFYREQLSKNANKQLEIYFSDATDSVHKAFSNMSTNLGKYFETIISLLFTRFSF